MTKPEKLGGNVTLYAGDCLKGMDRLKENSVDSVVCDPPYHLVSITKRFGKNGSAPAKHGKDGSFKRLSKGFMGSTWDGGDVAFKKETWEKAYRVLKPGAHLVAFCGTRNYHRLACAIEDAGFEVRDSVAWLYGTGFPKSHDVSKGIDKAAGVKRKIVGSKVGLPGYREGPLGDNAVYGHGRANGSAGCAITAPVTDKAKQWEGWGSALKPAMELICLARKPLSEKTVAKNVLKWGTGAINIDECRIEAEKATGWQGNAAGGQTWNDGNCGLTKNGEARPVNGRWPANVAHDGSAEVLKGFPIGGDSGSVARFFFTAKADADDRTGFDHPTVKPIDLMQWLVRMVTPKGGLCLDPFAGTGTTAEAAWREGRKAIMMEAEAKHQDMIRRRVDVMLKGTYEREVAKMVRKSFNNPLFV